MNKDYYLGLDIGTSSVGWAVTDENYDLCVYRKKAMWGVRLFDEAKTAEDRRLQRGARRRLARRRQRIRLLQDIFADEIEKVDATFFIRLNESRLHLEDKTVKSKHPLFMDDKYTDRDFYNEYPTIYHLREELISNPNHHDIRLVYLAIHHILKSRGHFLTEGEISEATSFKSSFDSALDALIAEHDLNIYISEENKDEFERILCSRASKNGEKQDRLKKLFSECEPESGLVLDKRENKRQLQVVNEFCKLIVGNKADVRILTGSEIGELKKFKFKDGEYELTVRNQVAQNNPDKLHLIDEMKRLYDWSIVSDMLKDKEYLSTAKVEDYSIHRENLKKLKYLVRKYCDRTRYKQFFYGDKDNNYAQYVGSYKINGRQVTTKRCSDENFYKSLEKLLDDIKSNQSIASSDQDYKLLSEFYQSIENRDLLPLQRNKANSTIPRQIHERELVQILKNASSYLPFLADIDSDGVSNAEKIISIFNFRIPYYVGPLSDRHKADGANVWIARKKGVTGRIYPWNFERKVDLVESNRRFIRRMTNKCSYLVGEDVLPKNSLIYSKFMVLNEINNIKVRGNYISVETKQNIYQDLFMKWKTVGFDTLYKYLKKQMPDLAKEDLSGFDQNFKASLRPYQDFKCIFGASIDQPRVSHMVEKIIFWLTIYGNDQGMVKDLISDEFKNLLDTSQLEKILKLRYVGWGRLSKEFLTGVRGRNLETGEESTILDALWNTNDNLMQILSGRYSFIDSINRKNQIVDKPAEGISYEELVADLYTSPANKRAIWQTIKIVEEIKSVMGQDPARIFIEMARGGVREKKRTESRREKIEGFLDGLERNIKKDKNGMQASDVESIRGELTRLNNQQLKRKSVYLYFTQMGKCMYTGEAIDLDQLLRGNSRWDIDHIYPQSKLKDDSLDNLVLVCKEVNAKKDNEALSADIQNKMRAFWKTLLGNGLISKKKFDRLNKRGRFSEDELAGFIARQIVETRQSTKLIKDLLSRIYPKSKLVYVKAELVSDFRHMPLNRLKSRLLNDYHHAKDAYLNIVVGNIYDAKFSSNPLAWVRENKHMDYSIKELFRFDQKRGAKLIWEGYKKDDEGNCYGGTLELIRKVIDQDNILHTERTYCEKGKLYNDTKKKKATGSNIPLKAGLDPAKYGGYTSAKTSYFVLVEHEINANRKQKSLWGIPIYIDNLLSNDPESITTYLSETVGLRNPKILMPKIRKNSLVVIGGYPMRIRGENETDIMLKNNLQLRLNSDEAEIVRLVEKHEEMIKINNKNKEKNYFIYESENGINNQKLNQLYVSLLNKFKNPYKDRPANPYKIMQGSKEEFFNSKDLEDKVSCLYEICKLFGTGATTTADLRYLNKIVGKTGGKDRGRIKKSKIIDSKTKCVLVNQSVTGLFENRINL